MCCCTSAGIFKPVTFPRRRWWSASSLLFFGGMAEQEGWTRAKGRRSKKYIGAGWSRDSRTPEPLKLEEQQSSLCASASTVMASPVESVTQNDGVATFITKVWQIVENSGYKNIVSWSEVM